MRLLKCVLVLMSAIGLSACAGDNPILPASLKPTSDARFEEPPHEIKGKTKVDQNWIDKTVGVGQEVLGWQVAPRPPGLDAPTPAATRATTPAAKPAAKKKPSLWRRWLRPKPKPAAEATPAPATASAVTPAKWPGS